MPHQWSDWLKQWRFIADSSSQTEYVPVFLIVGGEHFEVLRISRFHNGHDGDKPHVENTIREFNDSTAMLSRATRDLGVVRLITNKRKPAFVLEPGGDVLEWRACVEGVSTKRLLEVMRSGDLGRRVRRRDRKAIKDSEAQLAATKKELELELAKTRSRLQFLLQKRGDIESERDNAVAARDTMQQNLIEFNSQLESAGVKLPSSGALGCALGAAQDSGLILSSSKLLPGHHRG